MNIEDKLARANALIESPPPQDTFARAIRSRLIASRDRLARLQREHASLSQRMAEIATEVQQENGALNELVEMVGDIATDAAGNEKTE